MALAVRTPVRAGASIPSRTLRPAESKPPESLVEHGTRRTLVVAGVMLAALLQTVDATIVNVALPTIQGNLGATVDEATWVVTAYVIANVVVIPLTPWLQTRFGRKNYFIVSILGFTAASMLCGMATSLQMLIFFRIVQGAFGGGLLATAQVILRETYPPEFIGTSQSIFTLGAILGPSIGPTLGGIITDNLSWQWVFDINLVPGILAALILALYLRGNTSRKSPVDLPGIALLTITIGALQYVLDQGQLEDWFSSGAITAFTLISVLAAVLFVWWELRTPQPIVDLRILRRIPVATASVLGATIAVIIFGALLLLPQFTVNVLGFTETLAGVLIGMRALPILLLTIPVGRIVNSGKIDVRLLIGAGLVVASIASIWLSREVTSDSVLWSLALPLALMGFGIAFVFSPILVAVLRAVPPQDAPKAASFVTLFTQLGGSIASASLVTFTERRADFHQSVLAAGATLHDNAVQTFLRTHPLAELYRTIATQATVLSYADAFFVMGVIGIIMSPLVFFLVRKEPERGRNNGVTKTPLAVAAIVRPVARERI